MSSEQFSILRTFQIIVTTNGMLLIHMSPWLTPRPTFFGKITGPGQAMWATVLVFGVGWGILVSVITRRKTNWQAGLLALSGALFGSLLIPGIAVSQAGDIVQDAFSDIWIDVLNPMLLLLDIPLYFLLLSWARTPATSSKKATARQQTGGSADSPEPYDWFSRAQARRENAVRKLLEVRERLRIAKEKARECLRDAPKDE